MKEKLLQLYNTIDNRVLKRNLLLNNKDVYNWLLLNSTFLNKYSDLKFIERVYCIANELTDRPNCLECANKVEFHDGKYRLYCSRKCKNSSKFDREKANKTRSKWSNEYRNALRERKEQTCQELFGGLAPACSPEVQRKMQNTYEERTGFRNPQQNPDVKEKIKATNLEKYGMEWNIQSDYTNQQRQLGFLKKYGVENIVHLPDFCQQQMTKKYGVHNPSKVPKFMEKKRATWIEKYGVDNPGKSPEIIALIKKIRIENGTQISDELLTEYEIYQKNVWCETEKNFREFSNLINPNNVTRSIEYHLDHIFSIFEGFKQSIDFKIIGHYTNLQLLLGKMNTSKGAACWKTKEKLIEEYERACKKI